MHTDHDNDEPTSDVECNTKITTLPVRRLQRTISRDFTSSLQYAEKGTTTNSEFFPCIFLLQSYCTPHRLTTLHSCMKIDLVLATDRN